MGAETPPTEGVAEERKSLIDRLEKLLAEMKDWERKPVLRAGRIIVEIVKMPERKTKTGTQPARLTLHIRLEDAFRGIFIENPDELEDLKTAISANRVKEIVEAIEEIAKKRKVQEYEL